MIFALKVRDVFRWCDLKFTPSALNRSCVTPTWDDVPGYHISRRWRSWNPMPVTLRPVISSDEKFLVEVYASTRRDEVSAWGWDVAQQDAFLKMQFTAQQRSYEMQYANSTHDIILLDDEPVGRLLVARTSSEIHLVDISLLLAARGKGIGTGRIQELLDEGVTTVLPVRLEVLQTNPAALLYGRLGFVKIGESGPYFQMEKRP